MCTPCCQRNSSLGRSSNLSRAGSWARPCRSGLSTSRVRQGLRRYSSCTTRRRIPARPRAAPEHAFWCILVRSGLRPQAGVPPQAVETWSTPRRCCATTAGVVPRHGLERTEAAQRGGCRASCKALHGLAWSGSLLTRGGAASVGRAARSARAAAGAAGRLRASGLSTVISGKFQLTTFAWLRALTTLRRRRAAASLLRLTFFAEAHHAAGQ